ncbi:hypothetical protein PG997_005731 [Apiospora hydei]|uniref:Uncharacterized protein n=1 Tax=Apiospora hydei TaxID=1337664 RepID=A0ABR1WLN6_9PEZI
MTPAHSTAGHDLDAAKRHLHLDPIPLRRVPDADLDRAVRRELARRAEVLGPVIDARARVLGLAVEPRQELAPALAVVHLGAHADRGRAQLGDARLGWGFDGLQEVLPLGPVRVDLDRGDAVAALLARREVQRGRGSCRGGLHVEHWVIDQWCDRSKEGITPCTSFATASIILATSARNAASPNVTEHLEHHYNYFMNGMASIGEQLCMLTGSGECAAGKGSA